MMNATTTPQMEPTKGQKTRQIYNYALDLTHHFSNKARIPVKTSCVMDLYPNVGLSISHQSRMKGWRDS